MKPGDLARLKDVGIRRGGVVIILAVRNYFSEETGHLEWTSIDYISDGEIVDGCDSSFLEVIECE